MQLGAELFELLNVKQHTGNMIPVRYGAPGLSRDDIAGIEAQLGFQVPDDFAYLFQNLQDPGDVLFPWSKFDKRRYDELISWVWHGIEFDIEKNDIWLERWGSKPADLSTAFAVAKEDFQTWPKLLPIYGHRFLPAKPRDSGNPIFSIWQTDIIYYGTDLAHYLLQEFVDRHQAPPPALSQFKKNRGME